MRIWKKFKFGIFDVDGTIFDNMPLSTDAFIEVLKKFNLPEKEIRKIYLGTNGMNLNDQLRLVLGKYKKDFDDSIIKTLNKEFFQIRDNSEEWKNSPVFPGVKELLEKLSENGVKNFVSSGSNTDEVAFRLKNAGILDHFSLVLGAEKIPKGIGHIEKFAKFGKVSTEEFCRQTFLLSDGANDMELAKKAGIFAIGITNTMDAEKLKSAGADMVVKSAKELTDYEFYCY